MSCVQGLVAGSQEREAACAPAPQERRDLRAGRLGPRRAHARDDESPGREAEQRRRAAPISSCTAGESPETARSNASTTSRDAARVAAGSRSGSDALEHGRHEGGDDGGGALVEPLQAARRSAFARRTRTSPRPRARCRRRCRPSGTGAGWAWRASEAAGARGFRSACRRAARKSLRPLSRDWRKTALRFENVSNPSRPW